MLAKGRSNGRNSLAIFASFEINEEGLIVNASPENLNGHKVILHGHSSPVLGRTDTVTPKCTWAPDGKGGWTCV